MTKILKTIIATGGLILFGNAVADVQVQHVAGPAYAIVGELGQRTYENDGLNATFGFIVAQEGVVLIDSGASYAGAARIAKAVASVTDKPITHVINTGSQDHRWLGNGYFAAKGAHVVALQRTVDTQRRFAEQHLEQLRPVLKERLDGTHPHYAPKPIKGDVADLNIGGVTLQVRWLGDAHFPGDAVVWLPKEGVLFSGDMVYAERLLGVLPWSDATAWRDSFHRMETLAPTYIVPGHGHPTDMNTARRQTGDYLDWLVTEITAAAEEWEPVEEVVARLADAPPFEALFNFGELHRGNVSRTYVQLEAKR